MDPRARFKDENRTIPFVQLPRAVLLDLSISPADKILYAYLKMRCVDQEDTWVSMKTIMRETDVSERTLFRQLEALKERGLISIEKEHGRWGRNNLYVLTSLRKVYGDDLFKKLSSSDCAESVQKIEEVAAPLPVTDGRTPPELSANPGRTHTANPGMNPPSQSPINQELTPPLKEVLNIRTNTELEEVAEGVSNTSPKTEDPKNMMHAVTSIFGGKKEEKPYELMNKEERKAFRRKQKELLDKESLPSQELEKRDYESVAPKTFHEAYTKACKAFGYQTFDSHYSRLQNKEKAFWKRYAKRIGSLKNGVAFINWVIANWEVMKAEKPQLHGHPSILFFASSWVDNYLHRALGQAIPSEMQEMSVEETQQALGEKIEKDWTKEKEALQNLINKTPKRVQI